MEFLLLLCVDAEDKILSIEEEDEFINVDEDDRLLGAPAELSSLSTLRTC